MDLSNLDSKFTECLGPSTIAAALVDNSCVRQLWLQNRFRPNTKDSKSLEKWKLQHGSCLINLTSYLSNKHPEAKVDSEVQLPKIKFLGVTLFGAVDCLLQMPNGEIGIFDAKTGARKSFHWFQIGIYYLMQKAIARNQGLPIPKLYSLGLFYDDGKFPPDQETFNENLLEFKGENALDDIFLDGTRKKLREILKITSQNDLPEAQPSINNCRFCKFNDVCPSSLKSDVTIVADDDFI